ncbi:MAG: tripartite tricarboxylate transporter substrate binding protein [Burkholderiales bacterium]|nr:tripartite tricarboxylate transporter substrate binding protein [Burkholderiales bacterium]
MLRTLLVILCTSLAGGALAQAFPSRPMRTIVPFPPGSGLDIMARLVSQKTSESLGQPVIVENRPGANGMIGSDHVAKAAPDGYTVLATTTSTHVSAPFLVKKLPYDPRKDVTPITAAMEAWTVLAVNAALPVNSTGELLDYMKRNPGKVAYGSPGLGNFFHLVAEVFQSSQGVSLLHVPYKGVVIAVQAAATGEVQMAFSAVNNVVPHMKSGRLKTLVVLGHRRYPPLPDVPASDEVLPGFVKPDSWFGFLGPAGLPPPLLGRLNAEYVAALRSTEVKSKLESMGFVVIANSPEEFRKMYFAGFDVYEAVVKRAGIQPE